MDGGARRDGYLPALDGLRAVAVVAVVLFHCDASWARGGFLGVSLFFTLSGFLITRLLIDEHAQTGRIALGTFWSRRVRRLAPAALLCLALVLATSRWLLTPAEIQTLRGDITAATASVANWRFLSAGDSYAELFAGRPSPLLHFWSLAIEEQFYFVFPCVVAILLCRRRWLLPAALALLASASLASSLLTTDHDLIYYGAHTRAVELLVGALLACLVRGRRLSLPSPAPGSHALTGVAMASTAAFVLLAITTEQTEQWLYRGGFAALALLWCPTILAAATGAVFARVLGASPLTAVGRRSYGIYVFHWPVFTMLTPQQLHLHGWLARACQLAIVAALTEVSFRIVERPIRERRLLATGPAVRAAAIAAIGAIVITAVALPAPRRDAMSMVGAPDAPVLFADGATPISVSNAAAISVPPSVASSVPDAPDAAAVPDTPAPTSTAPPPPTRVVVVGSAPEVVDAVRAAAAGRPSLEIVDQVRPGCSVIDFADGVAVDPSCAAVAQIVPAPDVLIVAIGATDHGAVNDRIHAGDPAALYAVAQQLRRIGVVSFERYAQQAGRVIVVDANMELPGEGDLLTRVLAEAAVSTTTLTVRHVTEVDAGFVDGLVAPAPPRGLRVMVIGDSTSYGVADALAHSGLQLVVLWAGHRNCPMIPVDAIQLFDQEFSMSECPSVHAGWPEQLASFRPDVVLAVDGVPEQAPQRYAGDDTWHQPGDAAYIERHDAGMRELLDVIAPFGPIVLLATAPANGADNRWSTDEHIASWNAQLARWDAQWAPVALIDYAELVRAAEEAAGHTLRPDGVHLDDVSVHSIVGGSLGPQLLEHVATLRAQMQEIGCLVDGAGGSQLVIAACAG